jgi:hypothetical protein
MRSFNQEKIVLLTGHQGRRIMRGSGIPLHPVSRASRDQDKWLERLRGETLLRTGPHANQALLISALVRGGDELPGTRIEGAQSVTMPRVAELEPPGLRLGGGIANDEKVFAAIHDVRSELNGAAEARCAHKERECEEHRSHDSTRDDIGERLLLRRTNAADQGERGKLSAYGLGTTLNV